MGPWYQFYVTGKQGILTPEQAVRYDNSLQSMGLQSMALLFARPYDRVFQEADGTYEVRLLFGDPEFARMVLDRQGLVIVREVRNEV